MDSQNVSDSDAGGEEANLSNSGDFNKDQSEADDSEDRSDEQSDEETPIVSVQERALLNVRHRPVRTAVRTGRADTVQSSPLFFRTARGPVLVWWRTGRTAVFYLRYR